MAYRFREVILYPHKFYSKGFRGLASAMNIPMNSASKLERFFEDHSQKLEVKRLKVINWGSRKLPGFVNNAAIRVYNHPSMVTLASDKLQFFEKIRSHARVPKFTTSVDVAMEWVAEGIEVFGRNFTGTSGLDIVTFDSNPAQFALRQLFVQYKKKKSEWRVHCTKLLGGVDPFLIQRKVLRSHDVNGEPIDPDTVDYRIRNTRNGFIFQRNNDVVPDDVIQQAVQAFAASGLDFAALDVIYNEHENQAYVLEANTAPGLEGSTVDDYKAAFDVMTRD